MWGFALAVAACGAPASPAPPAPAPLPEKTPRADPPVAAVVEPPPVAASSAPEPAPPPPVPKTYRTVLSVGDSFNGAFSLALSKRFEAEGARFVRDVWVAVAISTFARSDRMNKLVEANNPDLVLVNLGANDVNSNDPAATAGDVRTIVEKLAGRDCYWIAPALWKKDTGIVDVLAENVAPCRFFDSKGFKVKRRGDGWHPSVEGGAVWADAFWKRFEDERPLVPR